MSDLSLTTPRSPAWRPGRLFRRLLPGGAFRLPRTPARMAVQTTVAALATYGVMHAAGWPHVTWAVISALYVVQESTGGTIGVALGRIASAAVGTLLGLGCVFLIGADGLRAAASLLVASAVMSFAGGLRPNLRYGVVPAAIIILGSTGGGEGVVETAWERAGAIALGTVVGALAGLLVFPAPAHRSAERHLGAAIRRCGDLLAATVARLTGAKDAPDPEPIHQDIERDLLDARSMAAQSRYPSLRRLRRGAATPPPKDLVLAAEKLWHTLILIDRADGRPLPEAPLRHLGPALDALGAASCRYLGRLGGAVARGEAPPPPDEARGRLEALQRGLDELRRREATRPLPGAEVERVFALSFALDELGRNFDEIAGLFDRPSDGDGRDG